MAVPLPCPLERGFWRIQWEEAAPTQAAGFSSPYFISEEPLLLLISPS